MDKVKCAWCGNDFVESIRVPNTCGFCGGYKQEPRKESVKWKEFYKDWVVYSIYNPWEMGATFRFYAGENLKAEIYVSDFDIMNSVPRGCTILPYIEERLKEKGIEIPNIVWARIEQERMKSYV